MKYQLPNGNIIIADQAFIDAHYPDAEIVIEPAQPVPVETRNAPILQKIAALESGQLRGMREFMLTGSKAGLQLVEDKIAALRATLEN